MNKKQYRAKKEQFTQPARAGRRLTVIVPVLLIIILAAGYLLVTRDSGADADHFGEPVAEPRSYIGRVISMTPAEPTVDGGWITLPLELVSAVDIVSFELENNEGLSVPMMAYITPSGRLFIGSSMCEPCRGRTFSLAGETLVCDACRTTYTIESHEFISGSVACGSYPPVYMEPVIENGLVKIPLDRVLEWRIRA